MLGGVLTLVPAFEIVTIPSFQSYALRLALISIRKSFFYLAYFDGFMIISPGQVVLIIFFKLFVEVVYLVTVCYLWEAALGV